MLVKAIIAGIYDANCYIVMDEETKEAIVLDPGGVEPRIEQTIELLGAKVQYILITHGHIDHVSGVEYLADKYNVPFYITQIDHEYMDKDDYVFGKLRKPNRYLEDGETLEFGKHKVKVIATPGHTKGGVCFLIDNEMLFTGDTLFQGSIGRTDFLGGDFGELMNSIKTKLLSLDDKVEVYPGHGPMSTIGYEKRNNMYLSEYDNLI